MEWSNDDLVAVRENPETEMRWTHSQRTRVDAGNYRGRLSVEYKPRGRVLESDTLEDVTYILSDGLVSPEKLAFEVYRAIAGALFPKDNRHEDPSRYIPLVVDFEYVAEGSDVQESVHFGQFR